MAGNVTLARLLVRIGADSTQFSRQMYQSEQRFKSMAENLTKAGRTLTFGVSVPMALVGGAALKMALDAQEAENLFEVSMGNMADSAREFSEDLRDEFGLNAYEVRRSLATMQKMLVSMGLGETAAFDMSKGLVQLTYDMASFENLDPAEIFEKLQAGITGEAEPLKRLGILVNETTIKQTAWNEGLVETGEALTEVEKVQARFLTIMNATSQAQGDLARTIESPTNQLRIFREQGEQTAIEFGNALIPFLQSALPVFRDLADYAAAAARAFAAMDPETRKLALGVTAAVVAAGPMARVFGGAFSVLQGGAKTLRLASKEIKGLQKASQEAAAATKHLTANQRHAAKMMPILAAQTKALHAALAVGVGVALFEITTLLLENTEAGQKFNESLKESANVLREYADQLKKDQFLYAEQLAIFNKLRDSLGLTGEQWRISADHTDRNAGALARALTDALHMQKALVGQTVAQRQANIETARAVDLTHGFQLELAKQKIALADVTQKTIDMYGVMTQRDAEEAMAALVADFKLLASEGVSAEQLIQAFGDRVADLSGVADDYQSINFPQGFEDLAYSINTGATYAVGALADRLKLDLPDAASKAATALETSIGKGMAQAAEETKLKADEIIATLDGMAQKTWELNVVPNLDTEAFNRNMAELGLQPDTAGALP